MVAAGSPARLSDSANTPVSRHRYSVARVIVNILQQGRQNLSFVDADGVRLYVEETGTGEPIVFVHELNADHREWEAQVRWFSRSYRCVTYNARGYPPSDVPGDTEFVRLAVRRPRHRGRYKRSGHLRRPT